MTVLEDQKRKRLARETNIRAVQYEIKKAFSSNIEGEPGILMAWLINTTGFKKPFPVDPVLMNRAEGQRELCITIMNMVELSPEEILKTLSD